MLRRAEERRQLTVPIAVEARLRVGSRYSGQPFPHCLLPGLFPDVLCRNLRGEKGREEMQGKVV